MKSQDYFIKREKAWQEQQIKGDKSYMAEIKKRLQYVQDAIQKEVDVQWDSFSNGQKTTRSEAVEHASEMNVKAFARKAKKYVKEKDFSPTANKELKLYNLTMRVNRLGLLKANIGLELIATFDDLDKYFSNELTKAGLKESQRQASILDMAISKSDYGKRVEQVLNSSFKAKGFATFSDNPWMCQAELKSDLDKLPVRSVTMGRNLKQLAPELAKYPTQGGREDTKFSMQRLMVTETTRVQTGIQKQGYLDMEFEEFVFISEPAACRVYLPLNDKTFRVDDISPGLNCAPIHPFCRCSTAPYVDRQ